MEESTLAPTPKMQLETNLLLQLKLFLLTKVPEHNGMIPKQLAELVARLTAIREVLGSNPRTDNPLGGLP